MRETDLEEAGEALGGGLRSIWAAVAPPAAAEATAAAADASAEETADLEAGGTSQGTLALEEEENLLEAEVEKSLDTFHGQPCHWCQDLYGQGG